MSDRIRAEIYRHDPSSGEEPRFDRFDVEAAPEMRVLDVIRAIYEKDAGDLAFQYACRTGRCGTCGVKVNGRPVLACQERAKAEMRIEPLTPFPVLRDLVVDRTEVEERFRSLSLAPQRLAPHDGTREAVDPVAAREIGRLGSCISCMICVSACPAVAERPFDGPAFMLELRRLDEHPADHGPRLAQALDHGMLECFGCDICTQLCPIDLSPADAIRDFRRDIYRRNGKNGTSKVTL